MKTTIALKLRDLGYHAAPEIDLDDTIVKALDELRELRQFKTAVRATIDSKPLNLIDQLYDLFTPGIT